jgi:hypothetical protein
MWHAWERGETCTGFRWENPKEKDHLKDQGVDGKMGSKWIFRKLAGRVWSGFNWLRIGPVAGSCECGDEPSRSGTTELVSYQTPNC